MGVDPGQSGGLAIVDEEGEAGAWKMPATEKDLAYFIEQKAAFVSFTVIEKVGSMPGQGVASTFKFGMSYGGLRMALVCNGLPFEAVTPQAWQKMFGLVFPKKMGLTKSQKKNKHKARAQELFPQVQITHSIADALLIALFCRRTYG